MDFKSPSDQLIDEMEDLIQDCYEFERIRQLPLKIEFVLEETSKQQKIIRKYEEFKVKWNNWKGFEEIK